MPAKNYIPHNQNVISKKCQTQEETQDFLEKLAPYDVHEFIRSGRVMITKPMKRLHDHLKDLEELDAHKKVFLD